MMMYEIRTTLSCYWSNKASGFVASENSLMGWTVAADASGQSPLTRSGQSPLTRQAGRSEARHVLEAGRTITVYINPAHLVEVVPLGRINHQGE